MGNIETYNEEIFSLADDEFIQKNKLMDKKSLFWSILILIGLILIGPVFPGKNGHILLEKYTYFDSVLIISTICFIIITFLIYDFYKGLKEYKNGNKIVIQTSVKKITRFSSIYKIILTCPELKNKSFEIDKSQCYLGISKGDYIQLSILPKSKFVLDFKKL